MILDRKLAKKELRDFALLFDLVSKFTEIYKTESENLPYHINLIDELHANENAHSRIFAKLLRYKNGNEFPFLRRFLKDLCGFDLEIEKPDVKDVDSCGRIDIPIFDNKYVVLIENKVTDKAPDQNTEEGGQLARYIETIVKNFDRRVEEIFVVYTPKFTREPADECWLNKDEESFKNGFRNRFKSLSYKDKIYPWLRDLGLSFVPNKDLYLKSAVAQYVDHLEGFVGLRKINRDMDRKLQDFLKNELGLIDANPEQAKAKLLDKEEELNNAISQIQLLKEKYQKEIVRKFFQGWKASLEEDFPELEIFEDQFEKESHMIKIGLKFTIEKKNFIALIGFGEEGDKYYIGVPKENTKIPSSLQKILKNHDIGYPDDNWHGWKYTKFENAYFDLKSLIEQILLLEK